MKNKKLYRINGNEEFNWDSMYTHLWVQRHELREEVSECPQS